jgi:hypothetical protein
MKKLKDAQKQLARAVKSLERAASLMEDAGFTPQSDFLDQSATSIEELSETLAAL